MPLTLNLYGLRKVVNVDHEPPLVIQVQSGPRENHFLSPSAELFVLDAEEPGGDIDVAALIIEDLFEKFPPDGWIFSQETSGQIQGVVGGVGLLAVILPGAGTAQRPRGLFPLLVPPGDSTASPGGSPVVPPGVSLLPRPGEAAGVDEVPADPGLRLGVDERSAGRTCPPHEVLHTGAELALGGGESFHKGGKVQLSSSTTDRQSGSPAPGLVGTSHTGAGPELRLVVTDAGRGQTEGVVDLLFLRIDGVQLVSGIFLPADRVPGHGGVTVSLALNILLHALLYLHRLLVLVVVDDEHVLAVGVDRLAREDLTPHYTARPLPGVPANPGLKQS